MPLGGPDLVRPRQTSTKSLDRENPNEKSCVLRRRKIARSKMPVEEALGGKGRAAVCVSGVVAVLFEIFCGRWRRSRLESENELQH